MSDTNTSGETPSSGAAANVPPAHAPAEPASFGSFGSSRGTGLARGKRAAASAPPAAPSNNGGYQPTSIEVVKVQSEYQNPFTPEASVAPAKPAPVVEQPAPVAVKPAAPAPAPEPAAAPSPAPVANEVAATTEPATKGELKILPPADTRPPAQSWENPSFRAGNSEPTSDDRPVFKPERRQSGDRPQRSPRYQGNRDSRRGERTGEGRPQGQERPERQDRPDRPARGPRPQSQTPAPAAQPAAKPASGGFLGWLKSLFGGAPAETPAQAKTSGHQHRPHSGRPQNGDQQSGDGQQRRRRRRGGRGRGRSSGGPRPTGDQGSN